MYKEFCCERMYLDICLFEKREFNAQGRFIGRIWYSRRLRSYGLLNYCGDWNDVDPVGILYCPFCGTKLPSSLDEVDMEPFLRKEYGWTDNDCWGYPMRELPEEFKTDEWWKKRGL